MTIKEQKCCICGEQACCCINGYVVCNKHYLRMLNHGSFEIKQRERTNEYDFSKDDYVIIKTKKGQEILVDKEDFEKVKNYSWCVSPQGYVVANIKGKVVKINWVLFPKVKHMVQDHINGNKLDNRKCNLRSCTPHQNSMNSSVGKNNTTGVVGVKKVKKTGHYVAQIMFKRKQICLGTYKTLEEATKVRQEAEKKYFGNYARVRSDKE